MTHDPKTEVTRFLPPMWLTSLSRESRNSYVVPEAPAANTKRSDTKAA